MAATAEEPLFEETCWLLGDVKKHVPTAPAGHTLSSWATKGITNRYTGERIFLVTIFFPQGRATSREALTRFLKLLNAKERIGPSDPHRPKTTKYRPIKVKKPKRRC